ncbi:MAG: MBL fold metallo-hydrolase [Terrimicrobiaceae bacterium]
MEAVPGAHCNGLPVSAVIYSHTHGDHWGGVRGIVDEADIRSGKISVIAPVDFMDYTVSENVYAGNAMNRRLFYQYGLLLPASPHGYVGQGLGPAVSAGAMGLIAPTRHVKRTSKNSRWMASEWSSRTRRIPKRLGR